MESKIVRNRYVRFAIAFTFMFVFCVTSCHTQERKSPNIPNIEESMELAKMLSLEGEYEMADTLMYVLRQVMSHDESYALDYADILIEHARVMRMLGRDDDAKTALKDAEAVSERLLSENSNDGFAAEIYLSALNALASLYLEIEDYERSIAYTHKGIAFCENHESVSAEQLYPWIAVCDNPLAEDETARIVALIERIEPGNDFGAFAIAAQAYKKNSDHEKALSAATAAEKIFKSMSDEERMSVSHDMLLVYDVMDDTEGQIEVCDWQLATIEKLYGRHHSLYVDLLLLKSNFCFLEGRYGEALALIDSCMAVGGSDEYSLSDLQGERAQVLFGMGNNYEAISMAKQCFNSTENLQLKHDMLGLITVSLIAETELCTLDSDERAKTDLDSLKSELREQALQYAEFCEKNYRSGHLNNIIAHEDLASTYYLTDEIEKMRTVAWQCERAINTVIKNEEYRNNLLMSLVPCYVKLGDYEKALALADTSCLANNNALPEEKQDALHVLSEINLRQGNTAKAQYYYTRLSQLLMSMTSRRMTAMPAASRMSYWRLFRQTLNGAGKYIGNADEQSDFAGVVYDLALYSKGLLLNSDANFRRAILSSGNEQQIAKMRQMFNLRSWLSQCKEIDGEEYADKSEYADELEKELLCVNASLLCGIATEQADWKAVKGALGGNDLAIEIVEYSDLDERSMYGAVMLKKGWTAPVFCVIGDKETIDSALSDAIQSVTRGDVFWVPLRQYIDGITDIYFSPAGIFHKVPIEYMSCGDISDMSDRFNIYRVSSTAAIIDNAGNDEGDVVVYGGLKYDADIDYLKADARKYKRSVSVFEYVYPTVRKSISLPYLEGTKVEADSIVDIVNAAGNGRNVIEMSGTDGSEASLKALSGTPTAILHIATHGFYTPVKERISGWFADPSKDNEDKALTRSGLFMSGAQNKYFGMEIPEGIDDGILTAQEISSLDFRNTDLVVLSACETARGDISGDGVFGLQRGFKKAGAQTIVMSLWKVDDPATAAFMTEFYRYLMASNSKLQSLNAAKNAVRSQSKWSSPEYWAAFIMLDGE